MTFIASDFPRLDRRWHIGFVPPSDTLPGVAVRWGRRRMQGDDVNPRIRGLRKMVSLRRHGRSGQDTDQSARFRCPKERAGRACAVHRVADPMVSPGCSKVRPIPRVILGLNPRTRTSEAPAAAGWIVADKLVRPGSIGPDEHRLVEPPQRDRSRGQKPPNGAPEGVTYSTLSRQLPAPRPSFIAAKPRRVSRAWPKAVVTDLRPISPLEGEMPRTGQRGVTRHLHRPMVHPRPSVSTKSPLQGRRLDQARSRTISSQRRHSHVR
jgi:hypothetical protein